MKMEEYKVIILGAGISGITCALYLERAGIDTLIIENNIPGGQLNKIDIIENYPGYKSITGSDLSLNLLEQINEIDTVYDDVLNINYTKKTITLKDKKYKYNFLVFATGRREKLLGIKHEKEYIGRGISLCATCDGALYKNKNVIVVGGANTAVSEALYLSNICKKITLVYRKDNLRADNILKERLKNKNNIEVLYNEEIAEYLINTDKIKGVKLKSGKSLPAECIFLAIGSIPNSELFPGDKVNNYIKVNNKYQNSIKDVYASGDVIKKELYQLITASSEGSRVASNIIKTINETNN